MRPTRFDLSLRYAREFVIEWFDQNPLGQIGVVGMRTGLGERIAEMSGGVIVGSKSSHPTRLCREPARGASIVER